MLCTANGGNSEGFVDGGHYYNLKIAEFLGDHLEFGQH
jgi:hypothetical protein